MDEKADLHLHTVYSDGALPTETLLQEARLAGLTTVSITDHDNTGAIDEAIAIGGRFGIDVIPGVELSTSAGSLEVHLLGYFVDHRNRRLQEYLALFRSERLKRAQRIVKRLNALNIPLTLEAVLRQAGAGSVGRPHIAAALVEEKLLGSYHEAFLKYIGFGRPAYEEKYQISPREAITLISDAGGLSFIAHPGNAIEETALLGLIKEGVDGIEVVHPSHSMERTAHYRGIVSEYFLLASGGSDFHGGKKGDRDALGRYYISRAEVDVMRHRLG
jgi:predicted metal-dependent phosphoesterase TrpH